MNKVYKLIDRAFPKYVNELQNWVKQPSVAVDGTGMDTMARLVSDRLDRAGGSVRLLQPDSGYPVVYGEFQGSSKRTLLFYNHYDVQPPGSEASWNFPPFGAQISEGKVYGRGVADDKGCLLSRIQAVEAFREGIGVLPVNVKFLVEGEEEIGSPNLRSVVVSHKDILAADACIWEYAAKDGQGRPSATLGNKGMCYVELTCRGAKSDFHSMYAGLIPNAAWRLVWALATLKDINENVLIDGFYANVQSLSPQEEQVLKDLPLDETGFREEASISELLSGVQEMEAKRRLYGHPTCTICGLASGYTGIGARTILPATATAKVDFRLVVDQNPDDILRKLRIHLDNHGFDDVKMNPLSTALPAKTPVTDPFVHIVVEAASHVYRQPIVIQPTSPGTGPRWVFSEWSDMPIVGLGVGHIGSQIHAPNENIVLEDYREGIKHIAAILELFNGNI